MKIELFPEWLREWEKENGIITHKGEWCVFNPKVFCQEGFCEKCNLNPKMIKEE